MPLPAGRLTVAVSLLLSLLLSLPFFLFFLSLSHSPSPPFFQKRDTVHPFEPRQVTVTAPVTTITTLLSTTSITISAQPVSTAFQFSSTSSKFTSSSVSLSTSSTSQTFASSALSSSTVELSTSSTSPRSSTHTSSSRTSSSSTFVPETSTSKTLILVPTSSSESFPTPATTFFLTGDIFTSASVDPPTSVSQAVPSSSSSSVTPIGATSAGFWNNKGAVGGTFAVVGLVAVGAIVCLLVTYIKRVKKNRARKLDEELFNNLFDPEDSRHASTPDAHSLNYPPLDPFAAGEVVQVRGSGNAFPVTGGTAIGSSGLSNPGHGSSDDGHASSSGHSSSNHHGFSSISYRAGARPESPLFYQPQKPAPSALSLPPHPYNLTSSAAAAPQSATAMSSANKTFSPQLGAGQVNDIRQADSDASYYADQIQSYYYGTDTTSPGKPSGYAF